MRPFGYARPRTVDEALDFLSGGDGRTVPVAGGTDLLVALRRGQADPDRLVDLTGIPELGEIRVERGGRFLRVGACVTHAQAAEDALVRMHAPLLAAACSAVGSAQIRNLGTVGGNVANASPAADTLPALAALDAAVEIRGPGGSRVVPLEAFVTGPNRTVLGRGELVTALRIPLAGPHRWAFEKVGRRWAVAISRVSVAVAACPWGGWARVSLGAVFPAPRRVPEAEGALARGFDARSAERAGEAAEAAVRAVSGGRASMGYKLPVVRELVARAARAALDGGW